MTMVDVNGRLETLEREARWWRIGALALLTLGLIGFSGPTRGPTDEVRTQQLVLVDATGRTRGVWHVREEGAELLLLGKHGETQVRLYGVTDMSGLYLSTGARQSTAQLHATADGWSDLHLSGKDREGAWVTRVDGARGLSQHRPK